MPTSKQAIIAHFKGLNLKPNERLSNAVVILWVSPEQEYYADVRNVQAMVDLINKNIDARSSEIHTVVAGYLQRFNFYPKKHDTECFPNEIDMAVRQAMDLGAAWYRVNKPVISSLKFPRDKRHKVFWQEILSKPEYLEAKNFIDAVYLGDPQYAASCEKTGEIFFGSRKNKEGQQAREMCVYNSQEYLREECAFLYALPQLYAKAMGEGKKIYIVYPHDASPVVRATLDLVQQRYPDLIHWLSVDLKQPNLEKFDLPQYLAANPRCGYGGNVEQAMMSGRRTRDGFFDESRVIDTRALNPILLAEANLEWAKFVAGSMLCSATKLPPKDDLLSHLSKFLLKLKEMDGQGSESSPSSSCL